jgi:hypothetical protein
LLFSFNSHEQFSNLIVLLAMGLREGISVGSSGHTRTGTTVSKEILPDGFFPLEDEEYNTSQIHEYPSFITMFWSKNGTVTTMFKDPYSCSEGCKAFRIIVFAFQQQANDR